MQIVMIRDTPATISVIITTIEIIIMKTVEEELENIPKETTMVVEVVENITTETVTIIIIKVITMEIDSQEKHKD